MTNVEAEELVAALLAAFPGASVSAEHFSDLEFTSARLAVEEFIKTRNFLPGIPEIRNAAREAAEDLRRSYRRDRITFELEHAASGGLDALAFAAVIAEREAELLQVTAATPHSKGNEHTWS